MKKILMGFFLLLSVFSMEKAKALTYNLTLEAQPGIYYYREDDTTLLKTGQFFLYRLNGILAYCVNPENDITTHTYIDNGNINYSEEIKEKIGLIGYYGREYPNHNTVRYSMATQALIWELLGTGKVTFWTGNNKTGTEIDVSEERNNIMNLVNNHMMIPDIPQDLYGYYNDALIIENEELNNYYISDYNGNTDSRLADGKLTVHSRVIGDSFITLTKKSYDSKETIIFVGNGTNNTQTLARLRVNKFPSFNINTHLKGIKIQIIKKDENKKIIKRAGIKFKVKDLSTNKYLCENSDCTFETNEKGYALTDGVDYGKYEIEEVEDQIIDGYLWNSEKKTIEIKKDGIIYYLPEIGHFVDTTFFNKAVNGILKLHKQREEASFQNGINYSLKDYANVDFLIYDMSDNYIDTITTDEKGEAIYSGLKVGKYYLKENNASNNYVIEEKIYFEIKQENQYDHEVTTNLEIVNKLKKGTLEIIKVDSDNGERIKDTIMEIYDTNDNLLSTKTTDEEGKITILEIPIGKYYIKEKEANYYYQKSDEKTFFEITENNEIVKKEISNKKIVGTLKLHKLGEEVNYSNNDVIYIFKNLEDIEFMLYSDDNNLIDRLVTNENGYAEYKSLPLGKYFVVEKFDNNLYNENLIRYYFEIKKGDNNMGIDVHLEIKNYLKKGTLEFTKSDLVTSRGIPNTIIEVYNEEDECILTRETDDNGKVIIENLPIGKYYIIEKEANSMYKITNEIVYFEINENNEIIKANMTNEKIETKVPKTYQDDKKIKQVFLLSGLLSLSRLYYERKRTF